MCIRDRNERDKEKIGRKLSRLYHDEPIAGADKSRMERALQANLALLPRVETPDCIYRSIDTVYIGGESCIPLTRVFPLKTVMFEQASFSVMNQAESLCMEAYMDYMRLPPDIRPPHIRQ